VTKDRRLGRGLAALLGAPFDDYAAPEKNPVTTNPADAVAALRSDAPSTLPVNGTTDSLPAAKPDLLHLNVYEIDDNPFQPRRDFSEPEIASLAESLKEHDMLQPIIVRRMGTRYQLISGERRLRAAIRAGWSTVPARLREADDRLVAELAIVENLQRKDLNPIEKALSFKRYLDEHQCTQDDLAQRLKIDRSTIANLMRLLELPQTVLDAVRKGEVSAGHARALLPLGDDHEQCAFAARIQAEGLSVRDVERMVQEKVAELDGEILPFPTAAAAAPKTRSSKNVQVAALEQDLRRALGTKIEVKRTSRGRGRIVIHFTNADEFDRLFQQLTEPGLTDATKAA
jgi:ParB family chromosome partitioning protein